MSENKWEVVLREKTKVVLYDKQSNNLKVEEAHLYQLEEEEEEENIGLKDEDLISLIDVPTDDNDLMDDENDNGYDVEVEEMLEVISRNQGSTSTTTTTINKNNNNNNNSNNSLDLCPLCLQPVPLNNNNNSKIEKRSNRNRRYQPSKKETSYFTLLSQANSRVNSPRSTAPNSPTSKNEIPDITIKPSVLNTGYFASFFQIIQRLGKGGSGTVELVQHVLNGEKLGLYACKKIAVGDSSPSLLRILREVHLLETLQHPNVVSYHHAWIESASLTPYGPPIPTLHILMGYSNGGSLDQFILQRRNEINPESNLGEGMSRVERIRMFRMRKFGLPVHLLRLDEILDIFQDVVEGLAFLHSRNILHLDLKAGNVLLHWDDNSLLPRAKLSDFGSSENTTDAWSRERVGGSGTLDWTPPEAWEYDLKTGKLHSPDRSTDLWGLGLILHLLSFFCLPYKNDIDTIALEEEIRSYPGFFIADAHSLNHGTRHDLPHGLLRLMTLLINRTCSKRPSCEEVLIALRLIRADSLTSLATSSNSTENTLVVKQRTPSPTIPSSSNYLIPSSKALLRDSPSTDSYKSDNSDTAVISELLVTKEESELMVNTRKRSSRSIRNSRNKSKEKNQIVLIVVLALLKTVSIQKLCQLSISPFTLYLILLPTLLDWVFFDWRSSTILLLIHLISLTFFKTQVCGH